MPPPKYYVIYVHEDRERFVEDLALRLRAKGVDAWFDGWEIKLGDSLRKKMSEGWNDAHGFIVVVSAKFVDEGWISEELDAAFVQKTSKKARILPLILDGVDPPLELRGTRYTHVRSIPIGDDQLGEVVSAIFDQKLARPVGPPPRFTVAASVESPFGSALGIKAVDTAVLSKICELVTNANTMQFLNPARVVEELISQDLTEADIRDSIEYLCQQGWLEGEYTAGSELVELFAVEPKALVLFRMHVVGDYTEIHERMVAELLNAPDEVRSQALADRIGVQHVIVLAALEMLKRRGLVETYGDVSSEEVSVFPKKPGLRRELNP